MASLIRGQREGPPTTAAPRLKSVCLWSWPSLVCVTICRSSSGNMDLWHPWRPGGRVRSKVCSFRLLGALPPLTKAREPRAPHRGPRGPVGPPTSSLLHPLLNINFAAFRNSPPTHTPGKKANHGLAHLPDSHLSSFWSSNFLPSCQIFIAL